MFHRTGKLSALFPVLLLIISASPAAFGATDATQVSLQEAANGSWRSDANKARDVYRHPVETLQFFGIRPDMTVIELSPGGGWYTEILAPYLAARGHLIEAASPKAEKFTAKLKGNPAVFGHITRVIPFAPPEQVNLGPSRSADMVLTFRNTHDWLIDSPDTLDAVFKAAFDVLKPGGILGIEEHRARPFEDAHVTAGALHRISEDYMISQAVKAGFRLADASEINANRNDPEDINVHRLPPDLAGPESEHAQMKAIGESDRMTLRFVKP
ncbi:class I SAM-dependent methyltransferase [Dyella soli]|uniref:Methyltransferase domain-containing protein n=1 Tax=Dyella soli TaxID=522319 RepID=A0A4R0YWF4_9GAMM|nr:class I SAM-dependent methyltransferase [Dyella soli]TCI10700.1 methyltransferase domain-containing protein [Dyella soli]